MLKSSYFQPLTNLLIFNLKNVNYNIRLLWFSHNFKEKTYYKNRIVTVNILQLVGVTIGRFWILSLKIQKTLENSRNLRTDINQNICSAQFRCGDIRFQIARDFSRSACALCHVFRVTFSEKLHTELILT